MTSPQRPIEPTLNLPADPTMRTPQDPYEGASADPYSGTRAEPYRYEQAGYADAGPAPVPPGPRKRLVRPRDNRWIGGVCSGLGRRFGVAPNMMRLLFVVSCLLPGPQFVIYLMLWLIMPNEDSPRAR